ncbi:MAG: putative TPR repeat methyltransferase [Ilumatobacter sp.]|jgi:predicted TPR repeat methyltransferase|tara:strand:- start:560 stop:1195 length:636 start_codon:yes stop_codon:yes gene_type:complete
MPLSMNADGQGLAGVSDASPAEVVGVYDDWVSTYDTDVQSWGYEVPDRLAAVIAAAGATNGDVLDAGCGTGLVGLALDAVGVASVIGADFSPESINIAKQRAVYRELHVLDLSQPLPFTSQRFLAVVCGGVFSYLTEPEAVLREFLRIVRHGGPIVFTQRVNLWESRQMDAVLQRLAEQGRCTVDVSPPRPYLPGHGEFDDGVHDVTLIAT